MAAALAYPILIKQTNTQDRITSQKRTRTKYIHSTCFIVLSSGEFARTLWDLQNPEDDPKLSWLADLLFKPEYVHIDENKVKTVDGSLMVDVSEALQTHSNFAGCVQIDAPVEQFGKFSERALKVFRSKSEEKIISIQGVERVVDDAAAHVALDVEELLPFWRLHSFLGDEPCYTPLIWFQPSCVTPILEDERIDDSAKCILLHELHRKLRKNDSDCISRSLIFEIQCFAFRKSACDYQQPNAWVQAHPGVAIELSNYFNVVRSVEAYSEPVLAASNKANEQLTSYFGEKDLLCLHTLGVALAGGAVRDAVRSYVLKTDLQPKDYDFFATAHFDETACRALLRTSFSQYRNNSLNQWRMCAILSTIRNVLLSKAPIEEWAYACTDAVVTFSSTSKTQPCIQLILLDAHFHNFHEQFDIDPCRVRLSLSTSLKKYMIVGTHSAWSSLASGQIVAPTNRSRRPRRDRLERIMRNRGQYCVATRLLQEASASSVTHSLHDIRFCDVQGDIKKFCGKFKACSKYKAGRAEELCGEAQLKTTYLPLTRFIREY